MCVAKLLVAENRTMFDLNGRQQMKFCMFRYKNAVQ